MAAEISLRDVAAGVNLLPSRLRHLFVQETGTSYRGYVLWLRINRAVTVLPRVMDYPILRELHNSGIRTLTI